MSSQLIALSFVLISSVALAIYGILSKSILKKNETDSKEVTSGFHKLANEVGRAAEEGTSIHITLGNGAIDNHNAMTSVAALHGLSTLIDLAAAYDTPPYMITGDPTLYLLADNRLRKAYARLGNLSLYRPNFVQFASSSTAGYAAVAAQQLSMNKVGTSIMLGAFNQEISLVSDTAEKQQIKSYGGSTLPQGLGALYPSISQEAFIIGEQLFAGENETQQSARIATLWTQDILRWLVIAGIVGTAIVTLVSSLISGG
jgi:hypothetical protein